MADFYVDHGAYGASNKLGLNTPAWGVPQEGDGSAMAAASAASIGSFKFTSVPTTGTISLCGATVSTTGVIGAADANTAANTLATNINATTATVSSSAATGTPQLRNLVYARGPSSGAAAGTCEVMMRIGSATLNTASNSAIAFTSTFDGSPTQVAFSGGAGGCWGWLVNDVAIGASSSIAALAYGMMLAKPYVWAAAITTFDTVWARTGAGQRITLGNNPAWLRANTGFQLNLVFDTNTKWTGDTGNGVIEIYCPVTNFNNCSIRFDGGSGTSISALKKDSLRFTFDMPGTGGCYSEIGYAVSGTTQYSRLYNILFSTTATSASNAYLRVYLRGTVTQRFQSCRFVTTQTSAALAGNFLSGYTDWYGLLEFDDCDISYSLNGTPADTVGLVNPFVSPTGYVVKFTRNRITTNGGGLLKWFTTTLASPQQSSMQHYIFDGNTGMKLDTAQLGLQVAARQPYVAMVYHSSAESGRAMRNEMANGISEWNPSASPAYPYLNARQIDGTSWSVRLVWLNTGALTPEFPFSSPRMTLLNRLADGVRTITQELLMNVSSGESASNQIGLVVSYTDSTGAPRTERTYLVSAPATSSQVWTNAGSYSGYAARKLSVTTSYAVKQNTEIFAEVQLLNQPLGSGNTDLYIDPEFSIT